MVTRDWWATAPQRFDLVTSALVQREASGGDPVAAAERLKVLAALPQLAILPSTNELAKAIASAISLPERARPDSLHVATAAVHGIDLLLTWNCRHLANAVLAHRIEEVCRAFGFVCPTICTPLQLRERP